MVVRMRKNRSATKHGRSHQGLEAPSLSTCAHCGEHHRPHHMCQHCGYYNGRQVIDLEAAKTKRDARIQAKKERINAEAAQDQPETAPAAPNAEVAGTAPANTPDAPAAGEPQDNTPEKKPAA